MKGSIDKFLAIWRLINNSDQPMTVQQITDITEFNIRTVQRHTSRLVTERLIGFEGRKNGLGYQFKSKELPL